MKIFVSGGGDFYPYRTVTMVKDAQSLWEIEVTPEEAAFLVYAEEMTDKAQDLLETKIQEQSKREVVGKQS
jgi:hypothetical protein